MGRINPDKTQGIVNTARVWTGDEPIGCPWFAFRDPFVGRVLTAFSAYKEGQLDVVVPDTSYRLIQGVMHYARADNRVTRVRMERDREKRERDRAHAQVAHR